MQSSPVQTAEAGPIERKQDIQTQLWTALQDHVRNKFEQQLLDYVDHTIEKSHPSYCSAEGRVIDRRIALRVGMSPGTISRIRNNENAGMTRLAHFLCMMNLCGISWQEIGFPQPQEVVLNALGGIFPLAQELLNEEQHPAPSDEAMLLLYFAARMEDWEEAYNNRLGDPAAYDAACRRLCRTVRNYDIETDHEPIRLIADPKLKTSQAVTEQMQKFGRTWKFLMETFPFLGECNEKSWGCF